MSHSFDSFRQTTVSRAGGTESCEEIYRKREREKEEEQEERERERTSGVKCRRVEAYGTERERTSSGTER